MAELGQKMEETLSSLNGFMKRTYVFTSLKPPENLRHSRRMHFALARSGELLQIKPLLHMKQDNPAAHRIRTQGNGNTRMMKWQVEYIPFERLATHADAQKEAKEMPLRIKELSLGYIPFAQITPIRGTHIGVDALGFTFISTKEV